MAHINIVVMGKTGAGKSTLINSVLHEEIAPTGVGQAVTRQNQLYSKAMDSIGASFNTGKTILNLYDTVGLEVDQTITHTTLRQIRELIQNAKSREKADDISLVWFCVNCKSSRFEPFEIDLIRSLSLEYEIPFVIVLTQCYEDEQEDLEIQVKKDFPEVPLCRVLAKPFKIRGGILPSFGVDALLSKSIKEYSKTKVRILESKLCLLSTSRSERISKLRSKGQSCVEKYSDKATKIGFVPGGCIPIVHGLCISMIAELNRIVGIASTKDLATDIFANAAVGIIATPLMVIPVLSAAVAYAYVSAVGEAYLDTLMTVINRSSDRELRDNTLIAERIKSELKKQRR